MTKELKTNDQEQQLEEQPENGAILSRSYSGPIPPAAEFAKYNDVLPGAADRILKLAEEQSHHRQSLEKYIAMSSVASSILGTVSALVIVILGFASGTYLIMQGYSAQGLAAVFVPLASIVAAFLYREKRRSHEDDDNASET